MVLATIAFAVFQGMQGTVRERMEDGYILQENTKLFASDADRLCKHIMYINRLLLVHVLIHFFSNQSVQFIGTIFLATLLPVHSLCYI